MTDRPEHESSRGGLESVRGADTMTDQYHLVAVKPREPSMVLTWDPVSKAEAVRLRDKYRTGGELLLIVPEPECDQ